MSLSSIPSRSAPPAHSPKHSAWQRSRYWTTASFVAAAVLGVLLLSQGHSLHGGLMLLAATVLLRQSVLSRRARRQASVARLRSAYQGAGPLTPP